MFVEHRYIKKHSMITALGDQTKLILFHSQFLIQSRPETNRFLRIYVDTEDIDFVFVIHSTYNYDETYVELYTVTENRNLPSGILQDK